MTTETYAGWLLAWAVAIPVNAFCFCMALESALGILFAMKLSAVMMLLGRCFWRWKRINETPPHPSDSEISRP